MPPDRRQRRPSLPDSAILALVTPIARPDAGEIQLSAVDDDRPMRQAAKARLKAAICAHRGLDLQARRDCRAAPRRWRLLRVKSLLGHAERQRGSEAVETRKCPDPMHGSRTVRSLLAFGQPSDTSPSWMPRPCVPSPGPRPGRSAGRPSRCRRRCRRSAVLSCSPEPILRVRVVRGQYLRRPTRHRECCGAGRGPCNPSVKSWVTAGSSSAPILGL